jgi:hypothetical protein
MRHSAGFTALLLLPMVAFAGDGWEQVNKEDGVTVYSKSVKGSDLVAFKGETIIEQPLEKILAVLMDNDRRTEWVARLAKSEVLEEVSTFEYVIYQHFSLPLILSDRDYVYRGKATRDEDGLVTLAMTSCKHSESPKTVGVRANLINSSYRLSPEGDDKTRVEVEIHTDPKGMLPTWLVNMIQKSWPSKTLNGIRAQLEKEGIEAHLLPPVTKKKKAKKKKKKTNKATTVSASTARKR